MVLRLRSLWIVPFLVLAAAADAAPLVVFTGDGVAVEGLTPEGRAVVFSVGKPPGQLMPVTVRLEEMLVADGAGVAEVELPSGVAVRSVWAVVDVESGEVALAAPEAGGLRRIEAPGRGVGQGRRFLVDQRRFLEVLVVRPASGVPAGQDPALEVGVWGRSFGDGGEGDDDGVPDGKIEAVLDLLRPIGDSPVAPPDGLRPGDVVIGIDPVTLEIYALELAS